MRKHNLLPFSIALVVLAGCSPQSKREGIHVLFDTKAEAEEAAKSFNCTGAHQMGKKWMPCEKHSSHSNHHNH